METQQHHRTFIQTEKGATIQLGPKLKSNSESRHVYNRLLGGNVEACSRCPRALCESNQRLSVNYFVSSAHQAFTEHYPIQLSPDAVWFCIIQGFAIHVNRNAERLRKVFVQHEGKKKITVERNNLIMGSANNDWENVFDEFSTQIESQIGTPLHSLLVSNFSTTGHIEKAVSSIVLMDTLHKYYDYSVMTRCGIPAFYLSGTQADWQQLREKAKQLIALDPEQLGTWGIGLESIFNQILKAFNNTPFCSEEEKEKNELFWNSFYHYKSASGGAVVTGWINALFPYVQCAEGFRENGISREPWDTKKMFWGIKPNLFPCGLSKTPFVWQYLGKSVEMEFVGGIVGFSQEEEGLVLVPEFGWAVLRKGSVA